MGEAKHGGLAGIVAGQTAICSVGHAGDGLSYRGYSIDDLVQHATFEETAYLLIYGELPNQAQLTNFQNELVAAQTIPDPICKIIEQLPATSLPMDVLRTCCSALGCIAPENSENAAQHISCRLMAFLSSCLFYWYYFSTQGKRIQVTTGKTSLAAHILFLLGQREPDAAMLQALNKSLILYAEHEFNASTFAARVCVATGADFYGPITAAIATLSGPLHGGANEAAIKLLQQYASAEAAAQGILQSLQNKRLIMGFGHRVYTVSDPRSKYVKEIAANVTTAKGQKLFAVAQAVEQAMWQQKKLFPNLDFYSSVVYNYLGFESNMFTPLFVFARLPGWAAHIMEQRAHNKLIRPDAEYIGPAPRRYVELKDRE